jgi:hypothetical protein
MNILLLPGASVRNKEWIEELSKAYEPFYDEVRVLHYLHWNNKDLEFDLELEIHRLAKKVEGFIPYVVFAKSAGSVLACAAMANGILKPNMCLFAGLPLVMIQNHNLPLDKWLAESKCNVTFIQNENDPLGLYEDVRYFVNKLSLNSTHVYKLLGDTHDYKVEDILNFSKTNL